MYKRFPCVESLGKQLVHLQHSNHHHVCAPPPICRRIFHSETHPEVRFVLCVVADITALYARGGTLSHPTVRIDFFSDRTRATKEVALFV